MHSVYHQKLFKLCLTLDDSLFLQFKRTKQRQIPVFWTAKSNFYHVLNWYFDILWKYTANNYRRASYSVQTNRVFPADIAEKPLNHPVNPCKHLQCNLCQIVFLMNWFIFLIQAALYYSQYDWINQIQWINGQSDCN